MAEAISIDLTGLIAPLLIVAGTGLVFVIMMVIAMWQWAKVARARRWPTVMGTVLESGVVESTDSDGGLQYEARVKYQYAVSGHTYIGDRLAFGSRNVTEGGIWAEKKAHRTVANYPVGRSIQVVYDPRNPDSSVLEVRSAIAGMLVLIGVIFLGVGIVVAAIVYVVDR